MRLPQKAQQRIMGDIEPFVSQEKSAMRIIGLVSTRPCDRTDREGVMPRGVSRVLP